jgi:hypothetical protein
MDLSVLDTGRTYWVIYACRDIGYGAQRGAGKFIYGGETGAFGKHTFTPADDVVAHVYQVLDLCLFPDEVTDAWPADKGSDAPG